MPKDALEERSTQLEKIRSKLRSNLDTCSTNMRRDRFVVSHEASILLTRSEERAMQRHLDASHGHQFIIGVEFTQIRRRRPTRHVTSIEVNAIRRQRKRKIDIP